MTNRMPPPENAFILIAGVVILIALTAWAVFA